MSSNSSNQNQPPITLVQAVEAQRGSRGSKAPKGPKEKNPFSMKRRIGFSIGLPAWVFLGFMLAQAIMYAVIEALVSAGVDLAAINASIFNAAGAAIIYAISILLVLGVPWLIKRRKTTLEELGLQRPPSWRDILPTPVAFIVYLIITTIVSALAVQLLPFVDARQVQETGFSQITLQIEYIVAFLALVIIAPIAEEVLFRGYLFGKLRKYAPLWISILITSVLFAIVHFQWNVGIDVFVLSIVLCLLRVYTGSLWAPILLHMLKNGIAFYFLFINPIVL